MSAELLPLIKQWVGVCDAITENNKQMKIMKEQKESYAEAIMNLMKNQNIDSVDLPFETITIKTRIQYCGINQEYLLKTLTEIFNKRENLPKASSELAKHTTNELLEKRGENEIFLLKRSKKKS